MHITNMVREADPTSKITIQHYRANFPDEADVHKLADLIINIIFLRTPCPRKW